MAWKLLNSRLHLTNRWLTLRENDYELRGGKRLASYWLMEKPSYVLVIGERRGKLVMVREWRPGSGKTHLSFPAGFIDDGETAVEAAVREFGEETGYTATGARVLGELDAQAAWLKATCTVVYVEASEEATGTAIDVEIEEVAEMTWEEVLGEARGGGMTEMHAVAGYYMARDLLGRGC